MVVKPRSTVENAPVAEVLAILAGGQKVKQRILRMRACNEKDSKGAPCCGHLKRWYGFSGEVTEKFGSQPEIYRCERCQTLYVPNPQEEPRSAVQSF
ncbi:MAG: hypothetical protein NTZ98_21730 [Acidobacteria bacterium]|jgi:hypothetical protein|nr:hypothetical protein [Acidobacteriota bacterium]